MASSDEIIPVVLSEVAIVLINAWFGHERLSISDFLEVETEGFILNAVNGGHEVWELVNGNGSRTRPMIPFT